MPEQNINIPDNQANFIRSLVANGHYKDASEVVSAGLQCLEREEDENRVKLERLRSEVQKGLDAIEAGQYIDLNTPEDLKAYFEEVGRRGRETLAKEADASTSAK